MEKKGGIRTLNQDVEAFKDFIKSAKLVDIFPKIDAFAWNNKRGGDRKISSRLDRFLVTDTILLEGITVDSDILPSGGSNHWPIIMNAAILGTPRNKPLRFEKFWLSHPDFTSKIKKWWSKLIGIRGTKMYNLQAKLKHIKTRLDANRRKPYGSKNLEFNGLKKGTSFQTHHEISALLINHFSQTAFEPSINGQDAIRDLLTSIPKIITEDQNESLNCMITMEEVEEAVRDMPNGKVPGPDGFTIDFYKACWEIIKTEVWEVVEDS
eukprot:PITA_20338